MAELDRKLAATIDHTLLRPDADGREVDNLCVEALRFGFATVCVQPIWVARAARTLAGSRVGVASVVSFPHGASVTATKVAEAARARDDGATELDVVANLAAIRAGDDAAVRDEIAAVAGGAAFVKTSTGFSAGGASELAVRTMREAVGPAIGVKASGGIRTRAQALAMLAAGASRLGASASVSIVLDVTPSPQARY